MFLRVPAHPGCPRQSPSSHKTVVYVCVCVIVSDCPFWLVAKTAHHCAFTHCIYKYFQKTSISAHADGTHVTMAPTPRAARVLAIIGCIPHVTCTSAFSLSSPSADNTNPPTVAVYIALTVSQCDVAKFSNSSVWDKVPEGSTGTLFWGYPNFPKTQCSTG